MINDHRPYRIKRAYLAFERWYTKHFIAPQFAALGSNSHCMKPWNLRISGGHISIGNNLHVVTARDRLVCLSTWQYREHQGHINIGNNCLLCPGVRIDSASEVTIEDDCMLAAGAYVTDADWHDIYDRTLPVGTTKSTRLGRNVWIGDGATVCKGVTVGENSVIGAGAVVTTNIPANVIAAGNPARVIRPLDEGRPLKSRASMFESPAALATETDNIDRYVLHHNGVLGWLRSVLLPRRGD